MLETPDGVADSNAHATVTVRLLLDKSGWVLHADAVDAPEPRLAAAAVKLFKGPFFSRATRGNEPVVASRDRKISFRPKTELDAEIPSSDCVPASYHPVIREEDLTDDVELPRLLNRVEPVYPDSLRRDLVEGQAKFECIVDTCGHVRDCRVVDATRAAFAKAGLDAVVSRRYAPARRNGIPVATAFTINVTFRIGYR